jgi:hypothetical protein
MRLTSLLAVAVVGTAWIVSVGAQSAAPQADGRRGGPSTSAKATVDKSGPPATVSDDAAQLATVKQYCATCHNDRVKTASASTT